MVELTIARKAANAAEYLHKNQFRRDGITPYFSHPNRVGRYLTLQNRSEKVIAAGFLHDVLEDCENALETMVAYGVTRDIISLVETLTKGEEEDYWDYMERIKENEEAVQVKLADILDNLSDSPTPKQIQKYLKALDFLLKKE